MRAGWRWGGKLSVLFRYIMVYMRMRHPSRNVKLAVGYMDRKLREVIRAENTVSGLINQKVLFD